MRTALPIPAADGFYAAPSHLAEVAPGEVLGVRDVRLGAFGRVPLRVRARQLKYRTTDHLGRPEVSVTTVIAPAAGSAGVLSYQCAIDAVSQRCLPSYALRHGAAALGALAQLQLPMILAAVRRGWTVSIPDHGGLSGHFGAAREPGYRALDGVRAVLGDTDPATVATAFWGYSGGGLATAWAAEVAGDYAPELNAVGAVAGAPVGDPAQTFRRLNGGMFSGFPTVFIAGLRRAYPQLRDVLDRHGAEGLQAALDDVEGRTTLQVLVRSLRRDFGRHLRFGAEELLADPELAVVLAEITPGRQAPAMPLLVQQGIRDEVIDVADIDALVGRYRAAGAEVTYQRVRFGLHLPLEFATAGAALRWLGEQRARSHGFARA